MQRVRHGRRIAAFVAVLGFVTGAAAWATYEPAGAPPIVVLISLDGWRWDYLDRADTPHLRALAARGVRAQGLIPPFPTVTFPSHYTIVTGLQPDRHGIVSNSMRDTTIGGDLFRMSARTAKDPRWWGGEPIWLTAMRQGRTSATMFWPGSEAVHPTHWRPFDDNVPNAERVKQALAWLALPDAERPGIVTIYFSDTDSAGHDFGPDSPELLAAAARLDEAVGALVAGVTALGSTIERRSLSCRTTACRRRVPIGSCCSTTMCRARRSRRSTRAPCWPSTRSAG